jgi:hypothetical protein
MFVFITKKNFYCTSYYFKDKNVSPNLLYRRQNFCFYFKNKDDSKMIHVNRVAYDVSIHANIAKNELRAIISLSSNIT